MFLFPTYIEFKPSTPASVHYAVLLAVHHAPHPWNYLYRIFKVVQVFLRCQPIVNTLTDRSSASVFLLLIPVVSKLDSIVAEVSSDNWLISCDNWLSKVVPRTDTTP